ncbi:hypothetical protein [Nocardia neocaledoniensis]|uniref:hypothetical protein n=1 Tax=Nocardia neocaledoniensis TaxID=236511 RepID=UPI002456E24E|nr:hypothetical protein [Nocardia neocaledoniensis]
MIRRIVLLIVAAVLGLITTATGAGVASAQPNSSPGGATGGLSSTSLPQGFPADLRKYIGGTEEFKAAEWFTGACKDRGGDLGAYLSAMLTAENRLMWWSMPDEAKKMLLTGSLAFSAVDKAAVDAAAEKFIQEGREPDDSQLPRVFPAGDATYHPPKGVCADDLKAWATASSNTWGFEWTAPDNASLKAAQAASGGGDVPAKAWTEPCSSDELGIYCAHAFFVNCNKAGTNVDELQRCREWNTAVGRLFAGTANWIDQNTSAGDRIGAVLGGTVSRAPSWQAGKWVVSALTGIGSFVVKSVKFIDDPSTIADEWANAIKPDAIDFSTKVLKSLSSTSHFDPGADWFRRQYAVAVAIGIIVMAFMALFAVRRASQRGGGSRELATSMFQYLPLAMFLALFSPGLASMVLEFTTTLSDSLAEAAGTPTGEVMAEVAGFSNATSKTFPGGSLMAIIMFGLMLIGALVLWLGLILHTYGMALAGVVSGISVALMIHPKYRHKALRPVYLFLGIAFSVPLLFLLLSVIFSLAAAVDVGGGDGGMDTLGRIIQVSVAMVIAGLAPWSLLKWAPITPTAADSEDLGSNSPSIIGNAVDSTGNAMLFARGGDSGGVGGTQPGVRTDGGSAGSNGQPGANGSAGANGSNGSNVTGDAGNPLTHAYQERGQRPDPVGSGTHPGLQHSGESGGAAGGRAAAGTRAGVAGGEAAAGAATGGAAIAAAVGVQTVATAINKAKTEADDTAPRVDDDDR